MRYQKLYASLAGHVDDAITILEHMAEQRDFDWFHIVQVTEMLKNALLEAEKRYIEASGDEPNLIILPSREQNSQS